MIACAYICIELLSFFIFSLHFINTHRLSRHDEIADLAVGEEKYFVFERKETSPIDHKKKYRRIILVNLFE